MIKKPPKNNKKYKSLEKIEDLLKSWNLVNMSRFLLIDWKILDNYYQIKYKILLPNLDQNNQ